MAVCVVTGANGLVGTETCLYFAELGFDIVGIDNNMRAYFFGDEATTTPNQIRLQSILGSRYHHYSIDIRDFDTMQAIFSRYAEAIKVVIHTAAQPSHDWAANDPLTDFSVNANGTQNLLELSKRFCIDAPFIFTSTNKVYGDSSNALPLIELDTRYDLERSHESWVGISESLSIDSSLHSVFGASKVAADVLVQEYGRYFGMKTACFRGGCLTGPNHSGAQLHGFLSYLMKCAVSGRPYTVFGYNAKQVRDNIHSFDLVRAFHQFYLKPSSGAVYNIGGGRESNCSMLEAIALCEDISGNELKWNYKEQNRTGDHKWWISDTRKFRADYPSWSTTIGIRQILEELYDALKGSRSIDPAEPRSFIER
jgi:CDP-paratose 2-epimerase